MSAPTAEKVQIVDHAGRTILVSRKALDAGCYQHVAVDAAGIRVAATIAAAAAAGATIPVPIIQALGVVEGLEQNMVERIRRGPAFAPPPDLPASGLSVDQFVALLTSGSVSRDQAVREHERGLQELRQAVLHLRGRASGLEAAHGIELFRNLQAAHGRLVVELRQAVADLGSLDPSDIVGVARAGRKTQSARIDLQSIADRIGWAWRARRLIWEHRHQGPRVDVLDQFLEFDNLADLHSAWRDPDADPPWPWDPDDGNTPVARLVWLVRNGARFVFLDPAGQDALARQARDRKAEGAGQARRRIVKRASVNGPHEGNAIE